MPSGVRYQVSKLRIQIMRTIQKINVAGGNSKHEAWTVPCIIKPAPMPDYPHALPAGVRFIVLQKLADRHQPRESFVVLQSMAA